MIQPIIFRIQDKNGRGPFQHGLTSKWVIHRKDHVNLIPIFYQFSNHINNISLTNLETMIFGCLTKEQLKRWFIKEEYLKLIKLGFKSYSVDVKKILVQSEIQCIAISDLPIKSKPLELY